MNKFSRILVGSLVMTCATVNADDNIVINNSDAIKIDSTNILKEKSPKPKVGEINLEKFDARIYDNAPFGSNYNSAWDELAAYTNKSFAKAVMIFQDSYREHLDRQRAKANPSDLLREDNYKYFLTLYDVLINEFTKMTFNIVYEDDSVSYVNRDEDDIIECITNERSNYKDIALYDASNWNYLLLINVLNQVKNSDAEINSTMIEKAAQKILAKDKYKEYKSELTNAVHDITQYFNELDLYSYLQKIRDLNLKPQNIENTHDLLQLSSLFESHIIKELAADDTSYDKVMLIPKNKSDEKVLYKTHKGVNCDDYKMSDTVERSIRYRIPDDFLEPDLFCKKRQEQIQKGKYVNSEYKNGRLTERDSLMLSALRSIFDPVRDLNVMEVVQAIYKKAQDDTLSEEEKTFLDLYNLSKLGRGRTKQLLHIKDMKYYNEIIERFWNQFEMGEVDPKRINPKKLFEFIQGIYAQWRHKLGYDPNEYRLDINLYNLYRMDK